ncbi:MAG TPA: hypothetical protein VK101_01120 [Limnochordia bacterium]|nr:hypothetical protein [Limnochordia bacterium]
MPHRLAFPPNRPVPVSTKLSAYGPARVVPLHPAAQAPRFDPLTHLPHFFDHPEDGIVLAREAAIDLLALDHTPLDPIDETSPAHDLLWVRARFIDPLERRVEMVGRKAPPLPDLGQCFGGVATQLVQPLARARSDGSSGPVEWLVYPLVAWGTFEIWVEDVLSDEAVIGVVQLLGGEERTLRLTLYPRTVGQDGSSRAAPIQAAETLGAAGWFIEWKGVDYLQTPVMTVRAERGDTLAKIAKEMSVDPDSVIRANADLAVPDEPLGGQLVSVPYIVRAATSLARRVHATALTWKEIIRGWTTLN